MFEQVIAFVKRPALTCIALSESTEVTSLKRKIGQPQQIMHDNEEEYYYEREDDDDKIDDDFEYDGDDCDNAGEECEG